MCRYHYIYLNLSQFMQLASPIDQLYQKQNKWKQCACSCELSELILYIRSKHTTESVVGISSYPAPTSYEYIYSIAYFVYSCNRSKHTAESVVDINFNPLPPSYEYIYSIYARVDTTIFI